MFYDKLNYKEDGFYSVVDQVELTNGEYKGVLNHDHVDRGTILIIDEEGNEIKDYFISDNPEKPWETEIELFGPKGVKTAYIHYNTKGDIVDADDINKIQDAIGKDDGSLDKVKEDIIVLKETKSDKRYVDRELDKKLDRVLFLQAMSGVVDKKADKDYVDKQIEGVGKVKSVNGKTGDVVLDSTDINFMSGTDESIADAFVIVGDMIETVMFDKADKDRVVTSVNGQKGDVEIEGGIRSSTIVIANHDSKDSSKKGADIVINRGENASKKINDAIQSLKGTGGEIKLMEGNYNLEYGIAVNIDGVHLTGIPKATILVQNTNWKGNPYANDRKAIIDTWRDSNRENVDVEISNLYVKGARVGGSNGFSCFGSSTINNCISENSGNNGFYCGDSSAINNCISENSGSEGFVCYDSSAINNCISENSGNDGFYCYRSSTVNNCISENSGRHGFYCYGSSTVNNCISENSGSRGFYCSGSFEGVCGFNTLIGDKLDDNSSSPAVVQYNIIKEV